MPRVINFFDGFTSNTQPSLDGIEISTNNLQVYVNDAAFEATNGTGSIGDIYANSTTGKIRWFNGTEWENVDKGGIGYQENIGTGDGSTTQFPLTFAPSSERSIIVFSNTVKEFGLDWNYNEIGNQIEFTSPPEDQTDIYVFYLTEGNIISVPVPSGTLVLEMHQVSAGEETAKQFTMGQTPAEPTKVLVDIIGGPSQHNGIDFSISGNVFNWNGLGLDGQLSENDIVRLYYYT